MYYTCMYSVLLPCRHFALTLSSLIYVAAKSPAEILVSLCNRTVGGEKRLAKCPCVINVTGLLVVCCALILAKYFCVLVIYKKVCLKEGKVWWKVLSNRIIFMLSHTFCHLLSPDASPVSWVQQYYRHDSKNGLRWTSFGVFSWDKLFGYIKA